MKKKENDKEPRTITRYEVIGVAKWLYKHYTKEDAIACVHEMAKLVEETPAQLDTIEVRLYYSNDLYVQFGSRDEALVVDLINEFSSRTF